MCKSMSWTLRRTPCLTMKKGRMRSSGVGLNPWFSVPLLSGGVSFRAVDEGNTQALWDGWSRAMETALYKAFSQGEGGRETVLVHGRGAARLRLRNLGPPRPRWEDNRAGMDELFQCERSGASLR